MEPLAFREQTKQEKYIKDLHVLGTRRVMRLRWQEGAFIPVQKI